MDGVRDRVRGAADAVGGPGGDQLSRVGVLLLLLLAGLTVGTGSAAAHGTGAHTPRSDLPRVLAITPAVPGVAIVVVDGGHRLRLDNDSPFAVEIDTLPAVPPGGSTVWADPRTDAAGWTVPLRVGDRDVLVTGDRYAPPAPAPLLWWALTVAAALVVGLLGVRLLATQGDARARHGVAAVTALVVVAHVVHVVGAAQVLGERFGAGTLLAAAGPGLVVWLFGAAGVALLLTGRELGTSLCAAAGALAALLTVFDTTAFHRPVLAYGWAYDLDRTATVLTVGCGFGLLVVGWVALRRRSPEPVLSG